LGINDDKRTLGVKFVSLTLKPDRPTGDAPGTVAMSADGSFTVNFAVDRLPANQGWGIPERTGMWTAATTATLGFRLAPDSDYLLHLDVRGGITPQVLASLRLEVANEPITLDQQPNSSDLISYQGRIPKALITAQGQDTILVFHTDQVLSPVSLGINDDKRTLGVKFVSLTLKPDQ
jgi:hypothetical protein